MRASRRRDPTSKARIEVGGATNVLPWALQDALLRDITVRPLAGVIRGSIKATSALRAEVARRLSVLANFVDPYERERREGDFSRTPDTTRAPEMRECFQRGDALNQGVGYPTRGLRTAFRNVVADLFEIICGVRRPADAHQPRWRRSIRAATSSCAISLPSRAPSGPMAPPRMYS